MVANPCSPDEVNAYLNSLAISYDLTTSEGRYEACYDSPLNFALIYLGHHLEDDNGVMSFALAHHEWVAQARTWVTRTPSRDAYVAPRSLGKSTFFFLILPMWAAAFGHATFVAAYADSADQAQNHLQTFRTELDQNDLLRFDFPQLVRPMKRNGRALADNEAKYKADSGFIFVAKGMDSSNLGTKDGRNRPDLIILDDIEPDEANYGATQKAKRLGTLLDSILYLNISARVVLSGTVTMSGSIVHDLVKKAAGEEPENWITGLRPPIEVHHHSPILHDEQGEEASIWPANPKFSLEFMQSIRGTTAFAKNYLNKPIAGDGSLWKPDSFRYGEVETGGLLLSLDPAVTTKATSDFTGIALVGLNRVQGLAVVEGCWEVRLSPEKLRERVLALCESYPVARVLVETNQGGDVWKTILNDLPVPLVTVHQSDKKEVRAARVYTLYDKGKVYHSKRLPALEEQMTSFPKGVHDDMVDAVTSGIAYLANLNKQAKKTKPVARQVSYLG